MNSTNTLSRIALLSFLSLATWLAAGCDTVKAPASLSGDELPIGSYPRVSVLDGLEKAIVGSPAAITPSSAQTPMRVTVPVRSVVDQGLNIQYQFEFFDAQGRPLQNQTGQKFVHLQPRLQVFLEANALDTHAADWRLTIRAAR